ncbi:MAG: DNA mismatch repair endonuclease MutL [Legionellaceae bacterium]|nr:DNA mismatch repair endonuclease MutL [Legionellaceae bacterium]
MRIRTLPFEVANQIAAGEVVERPASVVKELLENALDAGAKNIHIEIGFGGLNQIKISDDGEGIVAEDLPLAIAAHATSKLSVLDDLYTLESMGFRGEALASISAVSRLLIQSSAMGASQAMGLESDEQGIRLVPCARRQGTTIEVRDLFFNAPVRKKFLKSEIREYQAIEMVVKRIALSQPEVALTLTHNVKPGLQLPPAPSGSAQRVRLTKLLGKAFVDEAVAVDITRGQMHLHGWVSGPNYARSQQDKLWFYINQRVVRDKLVLHALKQAYADVLPAGRYPACVLFLTLPLDAVDINVHPSKYEVRFSDVRAVHDLIRLAITEMLAARDVSPVIERPAVITPRAFIEERPAASPEGLYKKPMHAWTALNANFALLMHEQAPYLIDVVRLHRSMRLAEVMQASCPWAARPLLVPISQVLLSDVHIQLVRYRAMLETFGLIFDEIKEDTLRVSAIPCLLPGLDLARFLSLFSSACEDEIKPPQLMQLLVDAEVVNVMAMTEDEQYGLIEYWKQVGEARINMSVCLDSVGCHKVFECA